MRPYHVVPGKDKPLRKDSRAPPKRRAGSRSGGVNAALTSALDMVLRKGVQPHSYLMPQGSILGDVVHAFVERRIGHVLLQDGSGKVTGMVTARDVLRAMDKHVHGMGMGDVFKRPVDEFATPSSALVHAEYDDPLQTCALIMSEVKVRVLPVLKEGVLLGVITLKDIADGVNRNLTGGKDTYVRHVLPRRGGTITAMDGRLDAAHLPKSLSHAVGPAAFPGAFPAPQEKRTLPRLTLHTGAMCIPGPGKAVAEDAHFVSHQAWEHQAADFATFLGVADGVGSWAMRGVDPAAFAGRLMQAVQEAVSRASGVGVDPPSPIDLLMQAWQSTLAERVVGSSTALVASLDHTYNQFATANLGDSGALVLRLVDDPATLGSMQLGREGADEHDWEVVFRTGQQLHGFNQPFQLGFDDEAPSGEICFDRPEAADVARTPVQSGDIIILASDGLFDNMHEAELLDVVQAWHNARAAPEDSVPAQPRPSDSVQALASQLASKAQALSMDSDRDSPFAVLAKDNDILWSHGGRMDDITVLCAEVRTVE